MLSRKTRAPRRAPTHLATQWKDVALVLTGHAQSTEPETGVASSGRARRRATCWL